MRRLIAPALAMIALVAGLAGCTPRSVAEGQCLDGSRPIVDVPDVPAITYPRSPGFGDGRAVDARGSHFQSGATSVAGMKLHNDSSGSEACIVGGLFTATYPSETASWDIWHDHTSAIIAEPNTQLIGTRFYNVGDAVAFNLAATDWKVVGMRVDSVLGDTKGGYVHDDCVQNDGMNNGVITDSKLDGCMVFLSAASADNVGTGRTVEVSDTLVRLRPYWNSYNTAKYGFNQHGGFFKWSGRTPQLYVHDSMFRADQRGSYGGNVNGFLALPPGSRCHDVTLVAKGGWGSDPANPTNPAWQQRDIDSWRSQCTRLRFAQGPAWDRAVAEWDAAHPASTDRGT